MADEQKPARETALPPIPAAVITPPAPSVTPKMPIEASGEILAIIPRTLDEAYRLAECFVLAGMAPDSYKVIDEIRNEHGAKIREELNHKATVARVATGIMHGLAVGFAPTVALAQIMIINGKAAIFGDGASALVSRSGLAEYIKTEVASEKPGVWGPGYTVTVTAKRKDQSEPVVRSFSFEDAQKGALTGKKGPWTNYPKRQCYWRAWAWACRDAFSDALCGLAIGEEARDLDIEAKRNAITDVSDLDDAPKQIQHAPEEPIAETEIDEEKIAAEQAALV